MLYDTVCRHCGKRTYRTRKTAKAAAKTIPGRHMATYPCPHGPGWHHGHLPLDVVHGKRPKGAYLADVERRRQAAS